MQHIRKILTILVGMSGFAMRASGQVVPDENQAGPSLVPIKYTPPAPFNQGGNTAPSLYNYTKTWVPTRPVTDIVTLGDYPDFSVRLATSYTNGWGRQLQTIVRKGTSPTKDLVAFTDRRASLRSLSYLPYPLAVAGTSYFGTVAFRMNPAGEQVTAIQGIYPSEGAATYGTSEVTDAAGIRYEKSCQPGMSFAGSGTGTTTYTLIHMDYNDRICFWEVVNDLPVSNNIYGVRQLTIRVTQGPHGAETREYINKSGQVVYRRVKSSDANGTGLWLRTYYVYDELGKLRFIIPPAAVTTPIQGSSVTTIDNANLTGMCFSYKYNNYGELIEKGTPGKVGKEVMLYDRRHRQVLYQDAWLRERDRWQFTVYDNQDRPVLTGHDRSGSGAAEWMGWLSGAVAPPTQSGLVSMLLDGGPAQYPTTLPGCDIHEYNYYDNYDFDQQAGAVLKTRSFDGGSFSADYLTGGGAVLPVMYNLPRGQLTGKKVRVMDNTGTFANQWISTVIYYDQQGNTIQAQTLNPWNTVKWDIMASQYNFAGDPVLAVSHHYAFAGAAKPFTKVLKRYDYEESTGRQVSIKQKTDGEVGWHDISTSIFDNNTGSVKEKDLGGAEKQKYTYNIRGQLTGINPLYVDGGAGSNGGGTFGVKISYDYGFSQNRYDGTIAGIMWRGAGSRCAYGYRYDVSGRLLSADYREHMPVTPYAVSKTWNNARKDYTVSGLAYDGNGNILSMTQMGMAPTVAAPVVMDRLTYRYPAGSNRLLDVADAVTVNYGLHDFMDGYIYSNGGAPAYGYDDEGNLTLDRNKGIRIAYNQMDLPETVENYGGGQKGWIENIYDAAGTLLQKTVAPAAGAAVVYRYWGPFVYKDGKMEYMLHEEGRCRWLADSSRFKYDFFVKDHLGNVRTVVTADEGKTVDYMATHELAAAGREELLFDHLPAIRSANPDGSTGKVAALDGSVYDKRIGASLLLKVMTQGDKFSVKASCYYEQAGGNNNVHADPGSMVQSIVGTLGGNPGMAKAMEGSSNAGLLNGIFSFGNYTGTYDALKEGLTNRDKPRSYINYIVFDCDMNIVPEQSGAVQAGSAGAWEVRELQSNISIGQNGYLVIYLSNEQYKTVYWDNLDVSFMRGRLLEEQHYYPFGLTMRGAQNNPLPNKFLYQGKLLQDEVGMELYDFHARQYDPQIGRFWGVDPLDQFPSGYTGMGNDPANCIDPSGMKTINSGDGENKNAAASDWLCAWGESARSDADPYSKGSSGIGILAKLSTSQLLRMSETIASGGTVIVHVIGNAYTGMPGTFSLNPAKGGAGYWSDFRIPSTKTLLGRFWSGIVNPASGSDLVVGNKWNSMNVNKDNSGYVEDDRSKIGLEGWEHFIGPALLGLAAPTPKRFVAANSSQTSAVLSEALSKMFPQKIILNKGTVRRLYTHTVNGTERYAATWGRFLGRWGTRIAVPLGIALTSYDFATEIAIPMGYGVQDYTQTYKNSGIIYHVK